MSKKGVQEQARTRCCGFQGALGDSAWDLPTELERGEDYGSEGG
jgi:hypothetical protein